VINYGAYLEKHPPAYEVEIAENSSWSCFHGIERWRNNCGCNSAGHKEWTQEWRAPLRGAMDWLRDNLVRIYEDQMSRLVKDPWKARDEYIGVILDRRTENVEQFLARHAQVELNAELKTKMLQLLEMQKHAMLMYTSCGWFFDEISGIESVQVMQYAARAMQLAKQVSGIELEEAYINLLERAPSNIPELKNGAAVYKKFVQPAMLDLLRVGVHYAVSSIFVDYAKDTDLYVFSIQNKAYERLEAGKHRLAVGHISLRSQVTWEEEEVSFAVLHLGDHNVVCGARSYRGQDLFSQMRQEMKDYFLKGEVSEVIRLIDKAFSHHSFSLWHLFRDEQRKIIEQIFASANREIEDYFRKIYEHHYTIVQAAENFGIPAPRYFASVVSFILNTDLRRLIEADEFDIAQLKKLAAEARHWGADLNREALTVLASQKINSAMERLARKGSDLGLMASISEFIGSLSDLGLELNLWEAQNIYFIMGKESARHARHLGHKAQDAGEWQNHFTKLGEFLQVKVSSNAST
jgi:alpha-amylase/alpha-mannosidase (GH57 family)